MNTWSEWLPFPDPRQHGYLAAPFGPGTYHLRNRKTGEYVLFGQSGNVAYRMSSLLPHPFGAGYRTNIKKREYVLQNLADLEYQTLPCKTGEEAKKEETKLKYSDRKYKFST